MSLTRLRFSIAVAVLTCCAVAPPAGSLRGHSGLASPHRAQRTPRGAKARLAFVDSGYLAEKGVRLEGDAALTADLESFGRRLDLKLFDYAKMSGAVFIAEAGLNLSDPFVKAVKARPAPSAPLEVPAASYPDAWVAVINTEEFGNPRAGVRRLLEAFETIDEEFGARRAELSTLQAKAKEASGAERKTLEQEYKQKQAAMRAAVEQRVSQLTDPIYRDVARALSLFCERQGISFVFDVSKFKRTDKMPPFGVTLPPKPPDVTAAFVSAYNEGALNP